MVATDGVWDAMSNADILKYLASRLDNKNRYKDKDRGCTRYRDHLPKYKDRGCNRYRDLPKYKDKNCTRYRDISKDKDNNCTRYKDLPKYMDRGGTRYRDGSPKLVEGKI